jgi:hypothetical protein
VGGGSCRCDGGELNVMVVAATGMMVVAPATVMVVVALL